MIYLDNAATTRIDETVLTVLQETASDCYGNPSSLYRLGFDAHKRIDQARKVVADALGCRSEEVVFTASGTEANNLALLGSARARKNFGNEIIITGYEHSSVFETAMSLREDGFTVHIVNPDTSGKVDPEDILSLVNPKTAVVSAMQVNNETGALLDVQSLAKEVKERNPRTAFHCDMVQGFLKYPIRLSSTSIDTAAVSAHKIHGPKGIGALYIRKGFHISPVIFGGGQENGFRSGTENVIFIAAMKAAVSAFDTNSRTLHAAVLNRMLRQKLLSEKDIVINSPEHDVSDYILNISLPGLRSETLLHYLDDNGIMVSSGSACAKGALSRTLISMGLPKDRIDSSIRISFSKDNTEEDIEQLVSLLRTAKEQLVIKKK